jgi:amino acid transporter
MAATTKTMTVRQAAFIGVGAMVGAGIFALLGPAGQVAGAAVWVSFLIAGIIAALQGYSFGKLGAKFPSGSGLIEYVSRGFGDGHFTGITAWLAFGTQFVVTAMVATSFGGYASAMITDGDVAWAKAFTALLIIGVSILNIVGTAAVTAVQGIIVRVVVGILIVFALVTLATADWSLLAPSGYPTLRMIFSSVALTFFAFLGFGVITFTAKDLAQPERQLPTAMYVALTIATVVYVAIALGVYGALPVDEVIAAGDTAVAEAAKPTLGDAGYTLMAATALFATAGATNSGIYPAIGLCEDLAEKRQFPPVFGRSWGRVPVGLAVMSGATLVLAMVFDLSAIASIGSAVALVVFTFVTLSHLRVRHETGARLWVLTVALLTLLATLFSFATTTLAEEPGTAAALILLLVLAVALDLWWKKSLGRAESRAASSSASIRSG